MRTTRLPGSLLLFLVVVTLADSIPTNATDKVGAQINNQIVIDVVVNEEHGQPVRGLRQEDFQVFEDHKLQQIQTFAIHEDLTNAGIPNVLDLPENTFSNIQASASGSVNVILLDELNTKVEDQQFARDMLTAYLSQQSPESRFAIFVLRQPDSLCISCNSLKLLQGVTANKDSLIAALRFRSAQPPTFRVRLADYEDTSMQSLAEIGNYLKDQPGRKSLIWLAGSFDAAPVPQYSDIWFPPKFKGWESMDPLSRTLMLHLASDSLTLARVAIYPIDLTGKNKKIVIGRMCDQSSSSLFAWFTEPEYEECRETGIKLKSVATESGGRLFRDPARIPEGITQAVADEANYYTLAYSPTNEKFNGKLRNIKVSVDRQEYSLLYREKYFADDPSSVYHSGTGAPPEIVLPRSVGVVPWYVVRFSPTNSPQSAESKEPILGAMRYGAPESPGIAFAAHVTAKTRSVKATPDQMNRLQDYESFRDERVQMAMLSPGKPVPQKRHKGQTILNSLPPPDPVFLQSFSVAYSIASSQFNFSATEDDKLTANLEIAILAYDELGRNVTGIKETVTLKLPKSRLQEFLSAGYHTEQIIDVPERAAVLRLAVRDVNSNKTGSLEIPMAAISSRHQRRRLEVRVVPDGKR